MACGLCAGTLHHCPACSAGHTEFESWEERLDDRRHQGSHITSLQANNAEKPVRAGIYSFNNGGFRGGAKYSREWNSKYDGPGKGTW